ncbi:hypothetical protein H312_01759 [Anncaliia algerae PRA339]|uniref:Uncharacterized protein n=1 Tax=Anncaliia algerae PRA339 TaxID=1288291 RepID=A0A059F127_9MICR|nr:hypothetical protein H312_01759 [Anncaliia algerae PRA339]
MNVEVEILRKYHKEIKELRLFLDDKPSNILLCGLDKQLIYAVLKLVCKNISSIKNRNNKKDTENVKVIDIDNLSTLHRQIIIYNALEESTIVHVILISCRSDSLENLEKRIKSRFSHHKIFFNYLKDDLIIPTLQGYRNLLLIEKYDLTNHNLASMLGLLNNLHFHLIILFHQKKKPITFVNLLDEYRIFMQARKGFKNCDNIIIRKAYFDLIDLYIVDNKGGLLIDFDEFKDYIKESKPKFILDLIF